MIQAMLWPRTFPDLSYYPLSCAVSQRAIHEPSVSQSGTQSFNGHMVKRGSPHLRCALMNVVMPIIANNKVFSDYYWKKRNEGKYHRVALTHVVKKLLRVIYHLENNNLNFDSKLIK